MNADGTVNLLDLLLLKRASADIDYSLLDPSGEDVNGDGTIDRMDVGALQTLLAE